DRDSEIGANRGQRHVHDRVVEHDHEQPERDGGQRPPFPVLIGEKTRSHVSSPSQSSKVGPASVASGPGSNAPSSLTSMPKRSAAFAPSIRTGSPRRATRSLAISTKLSSRGPAISEIRCPSDRGSCDAGSATR